ncbi:YafY family transcriptional regulator [Paenibacillus nanensis]|uniref:YafY family transcriptional regulator n=1 Tax=Paenibacillus nanensis TaxID=393251 RepID=A0A3A1UUL8_9BACL|nr:YafY family protein [Paenibacillus nanensis]RIX51466.1 YafY family transcriptional regulator [Paenibacillus nanensis]
MQKSQRLIQLIMMINARRSFTVKELADEFGLSTRTITRDLQELSELGIPIYSVQGRGGGYKLLRERLLPPISFTESEAAALFFACHSLQFFGSHPFGKDADGALHKFYHYLPADAREKIDAMKEKVMLWSPFRPMSEDVLRTLLQAVIEKRAVTIVYRGSDGRTERDIMPFSLYASTGYWYCPAYCLLREEVRQFRADRIESAVINPDIPYREDIAELTLRDKPDSSQREQTVLRVALTAKGLWQLESNSRFSAYLQRGEDGGGNAVVPIARDELPFYVDLLWALGEDAVIEAPAEAVARMQRKAEAMAARYLA